MIKSIVLSIGSHEVPCTLEQAKKLRDNLNELFGKESEDFLDSIRRSTKPFTGKIEDVPCKGVFDNYTNPFQFPGGTIMYNFTVEEDKEAA